MKLILVGQSTVIIELENGVTLITDPWFKSFSFVRKIPASLTPEDIRACDFMLVSHKHLDHLDRAALELAKDRDSTIIGPGSVVKKVKRKGYDKALEVQPGDVIERKGLSIHATSAHHPLAQDAIGFVIKAEMILYFSGDTRAEKSLVAEIKAYSVDIALVQIGCTRYLGRRDGMNLREAARFVNEIGVPVAIPIHYQVRGKVTDPTRFLELVPPPRGLVLPMGEPVEVRLEGGTRDEEV